MKVRSRDVTLFDLDGETVLQITRFVRLARVREGADIRLNDPKVVRQVLDCGANSTDQELQTLVLSIRRSLQALTRKPVTAKSIAVGT